MKPKNLMELYQATDELSFSAFMIINCEWNKLSADHMVSFKRLIQRVINECNNTLDYLSKEE